MNPIISTNAARTDHIRIDADAREIAKVTEINRVVFANLWKDRVVERKIRARQSRHDAARTRDRNAEYEIITDAISRPGQAFSGKSVSTPVSTMILGRKRSTGRLSAAKR